MQEERNVKYVKIFSDSQAAVAAIDSSEITSQAVKDAKTALNKLAGTTKHTVLVWIKAHVGHVGNEAADQLAKQGTVSEKSIKIGIPHCEMKRLVEDLIRKKWDAEWNEYEEGKHSKEFLKGNDKNRAKKLLELSRYEVSRYVSLVTGHGNLAYFLSKLEPGVNPVCRFCEERNETFIHLTECPRLK